MDEHNKVLNYLGMDFDYSIKGDVSISMRHYVEKIIKEFPDPLRNKVILTPATGKLFAVMPGIPKLCPDKKRSSTGWWHSCCTFRREQGLT